MAFSKEITGLGNEGRAVDTVYAVFSKVFSTISCTIFLKKNIENGLQIGQQSWLKTIA